MIDQVSSAEVNQPITNLSTGGENATPTPPTSTSPNESTEAQATTHGERGEKRKEMEKKPPKVPKQQSEVWEYFVKLPIEDTNGETRAACKYCGQTYACDPNKHGTTSLRRHIKKCKKNPHKATTISKQSMLNYVSSSGVTGEGRSLVPHLFDQKRCRRALAEFVICDELPFRIVEKKGFKKFVHELEPRFKVPCRTTVARDCWTLYLGEQKSLKKVLKKSANRVCLTTDCWTSNQNYYYLCLTAHFIDPEWKLHKRILNFCQVENHRGETIGRTIEKCLLDWGIEKVFTITMDNASANDTCLAYLKRRLRNWKGLVCDGDYLQLRCAAHILNLVVNEGLRELKGSFDAIQNAVVYVRSSPARFQKFKSFVESEKLDTKSLVCLDVTTRWNSTYLMLEAALKFQKVFERMQDEDGDYRGYFVGEESREGPPGAYDWSSARVFIKFLKIFYEITLKFSSSLEVTSSICFHQIFRIQRLLTKNINNVDPVLMDISMNMQSKYDKYWGAAEKMNPLLIVAVILDPRYKLAYVEDIFEQHFPNLDLRMALIRKAKDTLYRLFEEYSKGVSTQTNTPSHTTRPVDTELFDDDEDPGDKWLATLKERSSADPQTELDKYYATNSRDDIPGGSEFNILAWWKANATKYKVLSLIARDVFAMPVSTVASESAFSTGGRVVDSYRSSLSARMTEALICAQNWLLPGLSLSELVSNLRDFDNFEETDKVVQADLSDVKESGEGDLMDID